MTFYEHTRDALRNVHALLHRLEVLSSKKRTKRNMIKALSTM